MRRARAVGYLVAAVLLSACVGQLPELPEDRYYRLGQPAVPAGLQAPDLGASVAVARPFSDGLHMERTILYAEADQPLQVMRHHYDLWADSPPVLIQEHLVDFLRAAGVARRVVRSDSGFERALLIEPRLERFERILAPGGDSVVVALEFTVRGERGAPIIHSYELRRPVDGQGMYATVQAFDAALVEIYTRLLRDLAGA